VAGSYILSLPKDCVSAVEGANFISPFTSHLREMLDTGSYSSVSHAADTLRARMGLPPGVDLTADYIAVKTAPCIV